MDTIVSIKRKVDHNILLYQDWFSSFLENRKQVTTIDGFTSSPVSIGPMSVIQGGSLSCLLHLVFNLDLPLLFHSSTHTPVQEQNCSKPNAFTFVDDKTITIVELMDT